VYVLPITLSQQLQFLVNAQIPTGYQNGWLRLSINENPITFKPSGFFLGRNKLTYFPFFITFDSLTCRLFLSHQQRV
jgi:hypothetical protein